MKRLTRTVATAVLATALALVAGCQGSAEEEVAGDPGNPVKVTYLTSFGNLGRDSYAWVAKEKKFFADAGFDVEIKPGNGTGSNIKEVSEGRADFGPIDLTGGLLEMATGQHKDFVMVASIQQRNMAAIVTTDDRHISHPKDLEGKTLADTKGSAVRNLFPIYARRAKVNASKVKWQDVSQPKDVIPALKDDNVDGIGQFVVGTPTIEAVTKKTVVVLPYSEYMTDLYGNALITSKKLAREKPELVKRFTAALIKGLKYSIANPKEAGEILARNVPGANPAVTPAATAAAAAAELGLMIQFMESSDAAIGTLDSARVARNIAVLQGAEAIPSGMRPDDAIDFNLVPKS